MEKPPLISVLVPCYNAQKYIIRTIQSILRQTITDFEVVIVDDGSTDQSAGLIKKLQAEDARIRYVYQDNLGLPGARNTGLDHARGRYVAFVDNDDLLHERFLEILLNNLEAYGADISICEFENFDDGAEMIFPTVENHATVIPEAEIPKAINTNVRFVVMWNKLYRRELFDGLRFTLGKWHEDESMVHYIYSRARRVVKTSAVLYGYRNVATSMARSNFREGRFLDILASLEDRKKFYRKNNWPHISTVDAAKWQYVYWFSVRRHRAPFALEYVFRHPVGFFKYNQLPLRQRLREYLRISAKVLRAKIQGKGIS